MISVRQYARTRRVTRKCPHCGFGQQYLRTAHKDVKGTWYCHRCGAVDEADLNDPRIQKLFRVDAQGNPIDRTIAVRCTICNEYLCVDPQGNPYCPEHGTEGLPDILNE